MLRGPAAPCTQIEDDLSCTWIEELKRDVEHLRHLHPRLFTEIRKAKIDIDVGLIIDAFVLVLIDPTFGLPNTGEPTPIFSMNERHTIAHGVSRRTAGTAKPPFLQLIACGPLIVKRKVSPTVYTSKQFEQALAHG